MATLDDSLATFLISSHLVSEGYSLIASDNTPNKGQWWNSYPVYNWDSVSNASSTVKADSMKVNYKAPAITAESPIVESYIELDSLFEETNGIWYVPENGEYGPTIDESTLYSRALMTAQASYGVNTADLYKKLDDRRVGGNSNRAKLAGAHNISGSEVAAMIPFQFYVSVKDGASFQPAQLVFSLEDDTLTATRFSIYDADARIVDLNSFVTQNTSYTGTKALLQYDWASEPQGYATNPV